MSFILGVVKFIRDVTMETKIKSTPKINMFWISLLQAVLVILVLIYIFPLLLQTGLENYTDINNPPFTFGVVVSLIIELIVIIGFPAYFVIKFRAWKPAVIIVLLTILWLIAFMSLLLFS